MDYQLICQSLRPETFNFCVQDLNNEMEKKDTPEELRRLLMELNTYLYAYFQLKYQKNHESTFEYIGNALQHAKECTMLHKIGNFMLNDYLHIFVEDHNNNDENIISKALSYINEHFHEKLTLKSLSEQLFISENYLCRLFKDKTGYRFCEYINLLRIEKSKQLIEDGSKTLDYIAYLCGFSSQSHFSVTFKKYTKMSPGKYKSQVEDEKISLISGEKTAK